jgi:Fe-S oxidoreductase
MQDPELELKENILQTVSQCMNCRFCLPSCPLFEITEDSVSGGASGIIRALYWMLKWDETDRSTLTELRDVLYSCTTCRNCELACATLSTGVKLVDAIETGREWLIEKMIGPMPEQKSLLEHSERYSNPYGMLPADRREWMKGLGVPQYSTAEGHELLFYVGCTAPHDPVVGNMARAIVKVLQRAGVSFGITEDEFCCGSPSRRVGESFLFDDLSRKNVEQFKELGVKHIVTLSPHCFNSYLNEYPADEMADIKVQHYTQFLAELLEAGRLVLSNRVDRKVTYHDPCYLGRHNEVYEAPRKIISAIPGINFIEFERCRENSLCCGGGGGRMWSDFEAEQDRMANIRVRDALSLGVDTIVTACPFCLINIVDGIKSVNADDRIVCKDLAELVLESIA